jgi:hypothetical protein
MSEIQKAMDIHNFFLNPEERKMMPEEYELIRDNLKKLKFNEKEVKKLSFDHFYDISLNILRMNTISEEKEELDKV